MKRDGKYEERWKIWRELKKNEESYRDERNKDIERDKGREEKVKESEEERVIERRIVNDARFFVPKRIFPKDFR